LNGDESRGGSAEHVGFPNAAENSREATGNVEESSPPEETVHEEFSLTIVIPTALLSFVLTKDTSNKYLK